MAQCKPKPRPEQPNKVLIIKFGYFVLIINKGCVYRVEEPYLYVSFFSESGVVRLRVGGTYD